MFAPPVSIDLVHIRKQKAVPSGVQETSGQCARRCGAIAASTTGTRRHAQRGNAQASPIPILPWKLALNAVAVAHHGEDLLEGPSSTAPRHGKPATGNQRPDWIERECKACAEPKGGGCAERVAGVCAGREGGGCAGRTAARACLCAWYRPTRHPVAAPNAVGQWPPRT